MLALNDRKTEVILLSSNFYGQGPVPSCDLHVGGISMSPNATCNLGVMMDLVGTMLNHVSKLCKSASFALCKISRIGEFYITLKLIHAFVASRMDYCNSLLFGLPSLEIMKIQVIDISAVSLKQENVVI